VPPRTAATCFGKTMIAVQFNLVCELIQLRTTVRTFFMFLSDRYANHVRDREAARKTGKTLRAPDARCRAPRREAAYHHLTLG